MEESIYLTRGWNVTSPPSVPIGHHPHAPPPHIYTSPTSPPPPPHVYNPLEPRSVPYGYPPPPHLVSSATAIEPPRHGTPLRHIGTPGNLPLGGTMGAPVPPAMEMEVDPYYAPALVPAQKRGKSRAKRVEGKQPTFLTKLYSILEEPSYHHIIRWDVKGEIIIIEKPDELAEKILPAVYRQSRFASFSRQLNIYGFMRKVSLRHVEAGIVDPDASTWSHPFLHRDSPKEDIVNFKRRVPPRPSQSKRRSSLAEEIALSPSSSEGSPHSNADPYAHHLLRDYEEVKPYVPLGNLPLLFAQPQSPLLDASDVSWEADQQAKDRRSSIPESPVIPSQHPQPGPWESIHPAFSPPSAAINPSSAPAYAPSFPAGLSVMQGHLRTRSVQGEPPSATFWSPGSPLAGNSWTVSDDSSDGGSPPPHAHALFLKRSFTIDAPPPEGSSVSAPGISGMPRNLIAGVGGSFGPSSLPHDFAPGNYMLGTQLHPGLLNNHPPTAWSGGFGDAILPQETSSSLPTYKPVLPHTSPKKSAIQPLSRLSAGRRNTLTSPYTSPKAISTSLEPAGPVRGLRKADSRTVDEWSDGGLPSGGLRMTVENPFDHVLQGRTRED